MSVDLSKCNVGDKCVTRCGKKVSITEIYMEFLYPIICSDGVSRNLSGEFLSGDVYELDIVSVCEQDRRKVAKIRITNGPLGFPVFRCESLGVSSFNYMSRKNALRGARRFCARIGFECEVVK